MNKIHFALMTVFLLILAVLFPGCARVASSFNGSGKIINQDINVVDFTSVEVEGAFNVEISQDYWYGVTVSTDDNLIHRVLVSRENKTLRIRIQAPASFLPTSLKVKIIMPRIDRLSLTDEADASISGFTGAPHFFLTLKNGSSLRGGIEAETTNFTLSGASEAVLKGKSTKLILDCSGSSKLDLSDFLLESAVVKLRETSEATLNVNGRFDVVLSEGSKVFYLGNPLFSNTSISGGSMMSHR